MADELTRALEDLSNPLPEPHRNLSEAEKREIIKRIGPLTAQNILKAKKTYSEKRIPFLFSSVDTQDVVDVLANDMKEIISQVLKQKIKGPPQIKGPPH